MEATDIEFDLTVRKVPDHATTDDGATWSIENDHMRPVQGDSAGEVLDILVECIESEDKRIAVTPAQLAGEEDAPQQKRTDSEDRTCDLEGCSEPTSVRARTGRYCASDHSIADSNDWAIEELNEVDVEYDGESGTWRAPTQEQAESQWKAAVRARRK